YVFFATANGTVKKTALSAFSRPLSSGIRAITLKEGDELIGVGITDGSNEIMLFSDAGKVVRFAEGNSRGNEADSDADDEAEESENENAESSSSGKGIRPMGRTAAGVRGIKLADGDKVVSLIVPRGDGAVLTATENGYGKRTALSEYPLKNRATLGVISIQVSERNGKVVGAIQVDESDEIMLITNAGTLVRTRVSEVGLIGRNTAGVRLIRTGDDEKLVSLERVAEPEGDETDAEGDVDTSAESSAE
ncbi:MAG: DNA gyrase subunit A, partial [Tolumonas sp.]